MFEGAKVVRIIPDKPGLGGIKTGVSTQVGINDTRDVSNVYIYNGRWRSFPAPADAGLHADALGTSAKLLHVFAKYDLTNASATPATHILGYNTTGTTHRIFNYSTGATLKTLTGAGVAPKTTPLTAYFVNVKNRCFMCMGAQLTAAPAQTWLNNFIFDGTSVYDVGVDAPLDAPTATPSATVVLTGTCAATLGSSYVTQISGSAWSSSYYDKTIEISGTLYTIASSPTGYRTVSVSVGAGASGATGTIGTSTLTIGSAWPTDNSYDGLTIATGANTCVIGSYTVSGSSTTVQLRTALGATVANAAYTLSGKQFLLTTPFGGTTAWAASYKLNNGNMTWIGIGPKYAYAYYDPTTGHISNGSPIYQVTEQDQSNKGYTIAGFQVPTDGSNARFTKVVIFRSLLNGGEMLFPITDGSGSFATVDNSGVQTFLDNYDDSYLLTSGALQMPQVTNKKPPAFAHMAYWDGRVWGNPVNDPSGIWFSGDSAQIQFGVPEECYPTLNVLRIAAEDGRVTGMKIFGDYLIVITDRYSYYVTGNSEANYRLVPFPAPMYGVASHQVSQLMGQYVSESPNIAYMGNDWRMYTFNTSSGISQLSQPIQNVFDGFNSAGSLASTGRMIQAVLPQQRWLIFSYLTGGYPAFYAYDYENNVWLKILPITTSSSLPLPMAVKYGNFTQPIYYFAYGTSTCSVYQFGQVTGSTTLAGAFIRTAPMDFGRKSFKQLDFIRIYVTGCTEAQLISKPWTISIVVDDGRETVTGNFDFEPDELRSIQPEMGSAVDSSTATELVYIPTGPLQGHRFDIKVTWPGRTDVFPVDCLALDIAATDIEEQRSVAP